ncbi:MAG: hypothetical protein AAGF20_00160 [Pseudomonadota bacterium]
MKHTAANTPELDPEIDKLLKHTGIRTYRATGHDEDEGKITSVRGRGWSGTVDVSVSCTGDAVAHARVDHYRLHQNKARRPVDEQGNLTASFVDLDSDQEEIPSDIDSSAVVLTRNLKEDACLRFIKRRGCSMRGGNILLEIQRLWREMMPAMGVVCMEFTSGGGDADHVKAKSIDAATRLNILAARTTRKRWAYVTLMALYGMHPEDIARHKGITGDSVRRTLASALKDIAR